ncbi:LptF/LptG family permease, partial [Treponema pallidum]
MKILQVYMLDMFLPIFFLVLVCASMILDAIDILVNLTQFISNGYRFSSLVKIWYVSIPHYVLLCCPLSVLFA